MSLCLYKGLPPKIVTYIKINLRYIYSTKLFSYQEREDLIQDLVLFYLEKFYQNYDVPDNYQFIAIKTKALQIVRTRLREMQSGFFRSESLEDLLEKNGFELISPFSLSDVETAISFKEIKGIVSEKEWQFIELILNGETQDNAIAKVHITKNVLGNIRKKIRKKQKNKKMEGNFPSLGFLPFVENITKGETDD